jgi:hypothetical protein
MKKKSNEKNEKITFQRLKLQKKKKNQRKPFSVQFFFKKLKFSNLHSCKEKCKGKLDKHQYNTTRRHQQTTTKQNMEALTSTKDQRGTQGNEALTSINKT